MVKEQLLKVYLSETETKMIPFSHKKGGFCVTNVGIYNKLYNSDCYTVTHVKTGYRFPRTGWKNELTAMRFLDRLDALLSMHKIDLSDKNLDEIATLLLPIKEPLERLWRSFGVLSTYTF